MDLARDFLDSAMRDITAELDEAHRVQEEIENATVEAHSEDNLIHLTVGPPGRLRSLRLDPRVKRLDVETLAEKIVEMVNDASLVLQEEIANRVQALMPQLDAAQLFADYREMNQPRD